MTKDIETKKLSEWVERTKALLGAMPQDYTARSGALRTLRQAFHEVLAHAFEPALNAQMRTMPQATTANRQVLAKWVNHELHEVGLVIRCPKTQLPAILVADPRDVESPVARYRLEVRDESGHRRRTCTSRTLFDLELMVSEPRKEGLSRYVDPAGKGRGR